MVLLTYILLPHQRNYMQLSENLINYLTSHIWAIDLMSGFKYYNEMLLNIELKKDFSEEKLKLASSGIIYSNGRKLAYKDQSEIPKGSILELSMQGAMRVQDGWCSDGVQSLSEKFYDAYGNPNVSSILFKVDSGGGESDAGILMRRTLEDKNKPVVSLVTTLGSAAVEATLPSNEIIALSEHSRIGSIGSFISLNKKAIERYAENTEDIYSAVSDDKNIEFRELLMGNSDKLRQMITDSAKLFQEDVKRFRNLQGSPETIEQTLRGGMFFARDAKSRGLIDSIGTTNYALKRINSYLNK